MKAPKSPGVSLAQVAKAAGVSKMTASRVLRDASGFSDGTRDRVMQEVDRLGYVRNSIAAVFGSEQVSTIVGLSVPYLSSSLFGSVMDSLNDALARLGYQTMIGAHENRAETEEAWIRTILSWQPAGLILSGHRHTQGTRELLRARGIPVVEIWNLNTSPIDMSVGFNHFDCGYEMGEYVLAKGYKAIGYVGADALSPGLGAVRKEGFLRALHSAGTGFVAEEVLKDRGGFYAGFYGTENVLNRNAGLDAIYYQDDEMAIGGISYCQQNGLNVPDDIGIAGWGGMKAASILPQRLTSTVVDTHALGRMAAEALIARIQGQHTDDVLIIPARLAPGNTV
ncbi:LacI family DNA-binding transcriptional regulator [Rhizobiaceae bacterium]|nr:LacI family DNA-binding transcriptional regulator [Rhizobiaceae bacterium]